MLLTILKYRLRQIYNNITRSSVQKKLEWLVALVLIPYFVTLVRAMSQVYGMTYKTSGGQGLAGIAIGNMAVICFFVFISTLVLTLYRLPQSKDIPLFISLPIRDSALFGLKIIEAFEDAMRGIILPLPVIIAFASVTAKVISPLYAVLFIFGWVGIIFQIASFSIAFSLILGRFVSKGRWSSLLRIIAVISALAVLMIFMRYFQGTNSEVSPIPFLGIKSGKIFALSPATWLINLILHEEVVARVINGAIFGFVTIACPVVAYYLFKLKFLRLWMEVMEVNQRKKPQYIKSGNYRQMGNLQTFLLKESRIIKRDPHLLVGLFVPLIMFPAFMLFKDQQPQTQVLYITLISFLGTISYTLSCIGREGRTLALLRSLPIKISVILHAKFLISLMLNLSVTVAFIFVFSLTRKLTWDVTFRDLLIGIIASVFFSSLGIGLAALFPRLDYTNPMRAIAVPGLYAFYLISMLFIATMMLVPYTNWIFMLLGIVFWSVVAGVLLKLGIRRLEKMDV
jgi:ABC-2 type transport system permease protein